MSNRKKEIPPDMDSQMKEIPLCHEKYNPPVQEHWKEKNPLAMNKKTKEYPPWSETIENWRWKGQAYKSWRYASIETQWPSVTESLTDVK